MVNKIEGIIISEERHNELLAKEIKADGNTVSLLIPRKLRIDRNGYHIFEFNTAELELVGDFPDKESAVNYIKSTLNSILTEASKRETEAEWRKKEYKLKDSELFWLKEEVKHLSNELQHYNSIKNKWWFKLFNKKNL
jgi:hypothetical protein